MLAFSNNKRGHRDTVLKETINKKCRNNRLK